MPKSPAAPAEIVALYEKLVATVPGVERKGATMPYTSLNGNMYSYVAKDGSVNLRRGEPYLCQLAQAEENSPK